MPEGTTPNAAAGQPAGQQAAPATPAQGQTTQPSGSPQQGQQQAVPLTPEQARQIAREEALRVATSQVAQSENRQAKRIDQRITERLRGLDENKTTLGLTDDQVSAARTQIVSEEYAKAATEPAPQAQPQVQQTQPADDIHPLYRIAQPIFKREGIEVTDADPEFKEIEPFLDMTAPTETDLVNYIQAVTKATADKKVRAASRAENADLRIPGGAGAPATGAPTAASARGYWQNAYQKK